MKKLVIILAFFAVMMGFAIWEIVATTDFYENTVNILNEVEERFAEHPDALDGEECMATVRKLESHWNGGRNLVLMFGNHTVVRNADERITALCEFARLNEHSDAMVSLMQAKRYISDLKQDVVPNWANLF